MGRKRPSKPEPPGTTTARQREHRLAERVKPHRPLPPTADPWVIAAECLDSLDVVRHELRPGGAAASALELAAERVRQLAWGIEA